MDIWSLPISTAAPESATANILNVPLLQVWPPAAGEAQTVVWTPVLGSVQSPWASGLATYLPIRSKLVIKFANPLVSTFCVAVFGGLSGSLTTKSNVYGVASGITPVTTAVPSLLSVNVNQLDKLLDAIDSSTPVWSASATPTL